MASLMAALTSVSAYIILPIGPVPITMQTCFVLLSGAVLGSRWGAGSQMVYICLGLAGIPVFASGTSGLGVVLSPTFGYIGGFVLAAFLTGKCLESFPQKKIPHIAVAMLLGQITIWACGLLYLYFYLNVYAGVETTWRTALMYGFVPFVPIDLGKLVLAVSIRNTLSKHFQLESQRQI